MFIVATSRNLAGNQSPPTDPCHRDNAVLEQLALRLEHRPCELGQLVEKRDTAMPECAGMSPERSQPVVGAVRCQAPLCCRNALLRRPENGLAFLEVVGSRFPVAHVGVCVAVQRVVTGPRLEQVIAGSTVE